MKIEQHILKEPTPRKKRKSLIDQISSPIIEINTEDEPQATEALTENEDNSEIQTID